MVTCPGAKESASTDDNADRHWPRQGVALWNPPLAEMSLDLNLQPCTTIQRSNANPRENRLVVRTIFADVLDEAYGYLLVERSGKQTNLVYLLPALSSRLLKGVLDIVEYPFYLLCDVVWNLFRDAVPAACRALVHGSTIADQGARCLHWPEILMTSPIRTA